MMAVGTAPTGDNQPARGGVLPIVAKPRRGLSGFAIALVAIVMALVLFLVLDARRRAALAPAVTTQPGEGFQTASAPPPLDIPPEPLPPVRVRLEPPNVGPSVLQPQLQYVPSPPPPPVVINQVSPQAFPVDTGPPTAPPRTSSGAALVLDNSVATARSATETGNGTSQTRERSATTDRARAAILANRSTTVPQGTLIRAVLETALDSTRPGFARAIVSRDIMGFDGTRILIPRGSRLVGEYSAEVNPGQNRALINWTRLVRPDGATIAIASPSADTLGRAGIRADVNSHFFERFSAAILQSALDVGVNVAAGQAGGTVIYSLPGSQVNGVGETVQSSRITPTLKVKAGTSISVFVARDLDFSDVEK